MSWKEWPYWLKGGIYSIGIILIITLTLIPFGEPGGGQISAPYWSALFIPGFIIALYLRIESPVVYYFFLYVFPLFIYFLIGALIGWIVGKIKHKQ